MKQFKFLSAMMIMLALVSCGPGEAEIENTLVVEQVNTNSASECSDCLESTYKYCVKLKSHSGEVYYYTNFKHEIGDTLVSIFEFTDSRESIIKKDRNLIDSLQEANVKLSKKNDELGLYNELLMGIIQENATKKTP